VQESFLKASLEVIHQDHGGMDNYLSQQLKLTPAAVQKLRASYLG
jgi:protein tyrosine/serine phosphatase